MKKIIILSALLLIALSQLSFAQLTKQQAQKKYENLNSQWKRSSISTDSFLKSIKVLSVKMLQQQPVFTTDELSQLLNNFREAAWSADKYAPYKAFYFEVLMNNADMSGKAGEAIFYAGKTEQVAANGNKKLKGEMAVAYMKCGFYVQNGNYQKAIDEYNKLIPAFDRLTQQSHDAKTSFKTNANAIQISATVVHAYINENNLNGARQLADRAERLYSNAHWDTTPAAMIARIFTNIIHIEIALAEKDYPSAKSFLLKCDSITDNEYWKQLPLSTSINVNITEYWLKYYLAVKDYGHAAHYLKLFDEGPHLYPDYDSYIFQKKAELSVLKNDYKSAYAFIRKALDSKNKNLATVTSDVNDLLYAHAEAEFNKAQLASAEKAKTKRMMLFIGIGLGLLAIILILIILYRRTKTNADKRIASLNTETNFQIAKAREEAGKEEQSKIAQDLHDNYSAALAGIRNKLDALADNATSTDNELEIQSLSQYVETLYQSVRDKSHQLYDNGQNTTSIQLETSLRQMMTIALPDRKFKKEVDIDANTVNQLPLNCQIELLRIIQECITNIVKHAKDANEVFLFIFQEAQQAILQIGDNGSSHPQKEKVQKSLGAKSIEKRVQSMHGHLSVNVSEGYAITVSIPLPPPKAS